MTMQGKVTLVTGANSGIGYATALGLARTEATVILVTRDRQKGETAKADIVAATGNQHLDLLTADLGSIQQVKTLAQTVLDRYPTLDVLINNAAIIPATRMLTEDGLETQFAVNHLAYFILGNLLLPALQATPQGRIVNVSSDVHRTGVIDFDNLQAEKKYATAVAGAGWGQYANTKLMNVLFTQELARRLKANNVTNVTVNALHPGVIGTNLTRSMPGWMHSIYRLIMPGPERGARTSLYLATSPDVASISGGYFDSSKQVAPSSKANDQAVAKRLWEASAQLAGIDTI